MFIKKEFKTEFKNLIRQIKQEKKNQEEFDRTIFLKTDLLEETISRLKNEISSNDNFSEQIDHQKHTPFKHDASP